MKKLKQRLLLIAATLLIGVSPALAEGTLIDGLYYNLTSSSSTAVLTYNTTNAATNYPDLEGEVVVPSTFESGGKTYTVTGIKAYCFRGCSKITKVTLPATIKSVTAYSSTNGNFFTGCEALEEVVIPSDIALTSLTANFFKGATGLKYVTLPDKITSIGANAFEGCTSLQSIEIPTAVTATGLGTNAFQGCTALTNVVINSTKLTTIPEYCFDGCASLSSVTFGSAVKIINNYAFRGCTSLSSINLPAITTTIGNYAFNGCTSLQSIEIPAAVTSTGLGTNAFQGCTSLKDVKISSTKLTTLPNYCFAGCTSLPSFTLPATITTLNSYVFQGCTSLTSFTGNDKVTAIGSYDFDGCTSLSSVTLGSKITTIYGYAFQGCTALKTIDFPATLVTFGTRSFAESGLTEVTIPATINGSDSNVFEGCKSLTKVYVPKPTVTDATKSVTIYWGASYFKGCEALKEVIFEPCDINYKACYISSGSTAVFEGCTSLETLELPDYMTKCYAAFFTGASALKNLKFPANLVEIATAIDSPTKVTAGDYFTTSKIERLVLPDKLTNIGACCFQNMSELTEVVMPANMTDLNTNYLFYNCAKLSNVQFPAGLQTITSSSAFRYCPSLQQINLPETLTTIVGKSNFANCDLLTLTFPDAFEGIIGSYNFAYNANLAEVTFGKSMTYIKSADNSTDNTSVSTNTFTDCTSLSTVNFPAEMTKLIAPYLFEGCPLENINIPANSQLATLGNRVFEGTTALKKVVLPASLSEMKNYVFYNNPTLESVTLNGTNTVATAGVGVFQQCLALNEVNLGDNVTTIGRDWFRDCHSLVDVKLPASLTTIGNSAFYIKANKTTGVVANTALNITYNDKLEVLGDSCFFGRTDVHADLPQSIKSIGMRVFQSNKNVTDGVFNYPNLTNVGAYAFYDCAFGNVLDLRNTAISVIGKYAFTVSDKVAGMPFVDMFLPATLTEIGDYAIAYAQNLKRIVFYGEQVPEVAPGGTCCFGGPEAEIYLCAKGYAPPKAFRNYIAAAHLSRFFMYENELRNNFYPMVEVQLDNTEIFRWLPANGESIVAKVVGIDGEIGDAELTWTSTDEKVVSVDNLGNITFNGVGQAFVIATFDDELFGTITGLCRVNVYDHYYNLGLEQPAVMYVNDRQQLNAEATDEVRKVYVDNTSFEWSSSNPEIFTIDANGVATGVTPGMGIATVTWTDNKGVIHTATRQLTVIAEDGVNFYDEKAIIIRANAIHQFTTCVATHRGEPVANADITWESANPSVALVSSDGRIIGCQPGVTYVYAIYNGIKVPCTVTVIEDGMYNLTLNMPDAGGFLHLLGMTGDTDLQFVPDAASNGYYYVLAEAKHDGIDINDDLYDAEKSSYFKPVYKPYTVSGPLADSNDDPVALMAYAAQGSNDVTSYVPYTELRVSYEWPTNTGVDDVTADGNAISVFAKDGKILIAGATEGAVVTICDTAGRVLYQGTEHEIAMPVTGVLLLNVDNQNFKFILK